MPIIWEFPATTPCHLPGPAWLDFPDATTKKVPSRPRTNCDSGPGKPSRPFVTTPRDGALPFLDPAVWWQTTPLIAVKSPRPRSFQPGCSTTFSPAARKTSANQRAFIVLLLVSIRDPAQYYSICS